MTVIQWLCHYKCFSLFCKSDNIEWQSCNKVYIFLLNSSSLHLLHDILEATFKWSCQILIIITSEFLVQIQSWSLHIFFLSWCWFVFDCAGSGNLQLHRSGATLWLLTGEVNNTDCLFIMAPDVGYFREKVKILSLKVMCYKQETWAGVSISASLRAN